MRTHEEECHQVIHNGMEKQFRFKMLKRDTSKRLCGTFENMPAEQESEMQSLMTTTVTHNMLPFHIITTSLCVERTEMRHCGFVRMYLCVRTPLFTCLARVEMIVVRCQMITAPKKPVTKTAL